MMQNDQELVAPILDALSNFNLLTDDLVIVTHYNPFLEETTGHCLPMVITGRYSRYHAESIRLRQHE
jgi:hypothetical protein